MDQHPYDYVINAVRNLIHDSTLSTSVPAVINRLVSIGCVPTEEDAFLIAFEMRTAKDHICNEIAKSDVPDGLFTMYVDMVCGEYLLTKYNFGQLDMTPLDLTGVITSVSEGDTSVSFDPSSSDESKLKSVIDWMINGKGRDLICYRQMRW